MSSVDPIIVQSGINAGIPFALNAFPVVTNVGPPAQISTTPMAYLTDTTSSVKYVAVPNSAGTYCTVTNATETVRIKGGAIIEGALDSVQIGRAAVAGATLSVVIGTGAVDNNQQSVVIGNLALTYLANGVAIGIGANVQGNAGSASGIAIGQSASAVNSGSGGGD
jgi:hypothetical protein